MDSKIELLLKKIERPTASQTEAGEAIGLSQPRISTLIKKGIIEADEKNRPYIDSLRKYQPNPNMKRNSHKLAED